MLLQLASNCSTHTTAVGALCLLPAQLGQGLALQLLETAVLQQHVGAVDRLVSKQTVQQLGQGAVEQLLLAAERSSSMLLGLCNMPAAAQVRAEVMARLIRGTLRRPLRQHEDCNSKSLFRALCRLPAASQLGPDVLQQLLHAALQHGDCVNVSTLCSLPGSSQLSIATAQQLLQASLQEH